MKRVSDFIYLLTLFFVSTATTYAGKHKPPEPAPEFSPPGFPIDSLINIFIILGIILGLIILNKNRKRQLEQ